MTTWFLVVTNDTEGTAAGGIECDGDAEGGEELEMDADGFKCELGY